MKIAILDDYQNVVKDLDCYSILKGYDVRVLTKTYSEEALLEQLEDVEALVLIRERTEITEALLTALPTLKVISQTGKISNHIDPELCAKYGVEILEGVGSPIAPSELCWTLIMAASRRVLPYAITLKAGIWQQSGSLGFGRRLDGLTLGIWGYGKIGRRIAQYAKAFNMNIVVWGSEFSRAQAHEDGFDAADTKALFFQQADIISLHLRLNEATRYCVTQEDLDQMKPDSLFVNISRAELVEPNALYHSLVATPSKSAALDVFENEPATLDNEPLLSLPNVLATPHLGYVEKNSYELYFSAAFENLVNWAGKN